MNTTAYQPDISAYLHDLEHLFVSRLQQLFNGKSEEEHVHAVESLKDTLSNFFEESHFFEKYDILDIEERLLFLIALAPHIRPDFFDRIIQENISQAGDFPQIGGTRGKQFRGFLPTGQTAVFILAGDDFEKQITMQKLLEEDHFFARKRILWLEEVPVGEPRMSGKLILSQEYIDLLTSGKITRPRFGMNFPAQLLETQMEWDDLVLNAETLNHVKELETWVKHGQTLLDDWGMGKRLKPGYRALFYGPPGTGKTLTASLIGKYTQKDVYRIDLSMVVSKFIGETEKNLSNLFAKAENKDWILFFDEADALFGKRTNVKDAHDKYANQEVAYLLQRVEGYNGLVILASNFKSNIDDAFMRRFQSIIHFPLPTFQERIQLWEKAFPEQIKLSENIKLRHLAQKYELSGAGIMNVVQFACLRALEHQTDVISNIHLLQGIKKEFFKEGRAMM